MSIQRLPDHVLPRRRKATLRDLDRNVPGPTEPLFWRHSLDLNAGNRLPVNPLFASLSDSHQVLAWLDARPRYKHLWSAHACLPKNGTIQPTVPKHGDRPARVEQL